MKRRSLYLSLITLLCVCLSTVALSSTEGLLIYFPFDEGRGDVAMDMSGNNHHAEIDGARWIDDGKVNGALEFRGVSKGDIVQVINNHEAGQLGVIEWQAITVMAWVYPTGFQTDEERRRWMRIVDTDDFPARESGFWLGVHGTAATQQAGPDQTEKRGRVFVGFRPTTWFNTEQTVNLNEWSHVAFTWGLQETRGIMKGFINGQEDSGKASFQETLVTKQNLAVGGGQGREPSPDESFVGYIDEVAVYQRSMTADEIASIMEAGTAVEPAGKLITTWSRIKGSY